jgi:cell shape-determining protein MreD
VCHLKYEREPGFYYGAMYVSYALGVALFVTVWASCNLWFPWLSAWTQIGLVVFFTLVLSPYLFALSKIIWANFFISYDADAQVRK